MDENGTSLAAAKADAMCGLNRLREAVACMCALQKDPQHPPFARLSVILGESLLDACRCNECTHLGIAPGRRNGKDKPVCLVALLHLLYDRVCKRVPELEKARKEHQYCPRPKDVKRRVSPIWRFSNEELCEAMRICRGNLRATCEHLGIPATSHSTLWARVTRDGALRRVYDDCRARWTKTGHAKYPETDDLSGT